MQKEYDALMHNESYLLACSCLKLFKVKEKTDETVDRLKVRLVANGITITPSAL